MQRIMAVLGLVAPLLAFCGCAAEEPPSPRTPSPDALAARAAAAEQAKKDRAEVEVRVVRVMQDLGITDEVVARIQAAAATIPPSVSDDEAVRAKVRDALAPIFDETALRAAVHGRIVEAMPLYTMDALEKWAAEPSTPAVLQALRADVPQGAQPVALAPERRKLLQDMLLKANIHAAIVDEARTMQALGKAIADAIDPANADAFMATRWPLPVGGYDEQSIIEVELAAKLAGISDETLAQFLLFGADPRFGGSEQGGVVFGSRSFGSWTTLKTLTPQIAAAVAGVAAVPMPALPAGVPAEAALARAARLTHDIGTSPALDEARQLLRQADAAKPDDADILAELGFLAVRKRGGPRPGEDQLRVKSEPEHFAEARGYLDRALKLKPDHADAHIYLGYVEFLQYNDDLAAQLFRRARALGSKRAWLDFEEANLAQASGRLDEAFAKYLQLLQSPTVGFNTKLFAFREGERLTRRNRRSDELAQALRMMGTGDDADEYFRLAYSRTAIEAGIDLDEVLATLDRVTSPQNRVFAQRDRSVALALKASEGFDAAGGASAESRALLARAVEAAGAGTQLVENLSFTTSGAKIAEAVLKRLPGSASDGAPAGQPKSEMSPLLVAALYRKDYALMKRLLEAGADANTPDRVTSAPLITAAAGARLVEGFQLLLEHGADPAARMHDGRTLRQFLEDGRNPTADQMLKMLDQHEKKTP
jgi:tetratricopeptide (TPR) repeat protein